MGELKTNVAICVLVIVVCFLDPAPGWLSTAVETVSLFGVISFEMYMLRFGTQVFSSQISQVST
jgi:hypothetical protein